MVPHIKSLKQHFNVRAIEWGMAGWALTWGLMVLLVPSMFTDPRTASLFKGIEETVAWTGLHGPTAIGMIFISLGLLRGGALFVNGLCRRTPMIRIIASAVSAFLVMDVIVGISQGPPNTGTITYTWLFLADCLSARRAAEDWHEARKVKPLYLLDT